MVNLERMDLAQIEKALRESLDLLREVQPKLRLGDEDMNKFAGATLAIAYSIESIKHLQ